MESYISIEHKGEAVQFGVGVPLISAKEGLVKGGRVRMMNPGKGGPGVVMTDLLASALDGFDKSSWVHPLLGPAVGPSSPGWDDATFVPPTSGITMKMRKLDSQKLVAPLESLGTYHPYWVGSDKPTHYLFDAESCELCGVVEMDYRFTGAFWVGFVEAWQDEQGYVDDGIATLFNRLWLTPELRRRGVWVCIDPPPFVEGEPMRDFTSAPCYVSFDPDPDAGELGIEEACLKEEAAAAFVTM